MVFLFVVPFKEIPAVIGPFFSLKVCGFGLSEKSVT